MSKKLDSMREHFFAQMYNMTARMEFAMRFFDALEDKRLPHDRPFSLKEVFDAVNFDEIVEMHKGTPDPLISKMGRAFVGDLVDASPRTQMEEIAQLFMLGATSMGTSVLDKSYHFHDESGGTHDVSPEDFWALLQGDPFKHPVRGTVVPDAQERIEIMYYLNEPL